METVIQLIIIFAFIDLVLTLFWIYRWQSSKCVREFENKLPVKLIEANPIVRHGIEKFGLYPGAVLGYLFVFMIQLLLAGIHKIVAWIVLTVLIWAVLGHINNNRTNSNEHIVKMTREYNKKLKELGK